MVGYLLIFVVIGFHNYNRIGELNLIPDGSRTGFYIYFVPPILAEKNNSTVDQARKKMKEQAKIWAEKNNMQPMSILNNNLALSKMIKPLWAGCISSNDDDILEYLKKTQTAHLSWSSQGRGYFLPPEICQAIEDKITKEESSWRQPGENSSEPISC